MSSSSQVTNHEEVLGTVVHEVGITVRGVGMELAVAASTARRYLNELVGRGWVTQSRVTRPGQRPAARFYPTDRGYAAHAENEAW